MDQYVPTPLTKAEAQELRRQQLQTDFIALERDILAKHGRDWLGKNALAQVQQKQQSSQSPSPYQSARLSQQKFCCHQFPS